MNTTSKTFKEFIFEKSSQTVFDDIDGLKKIKANCSGFLKSTSIPLYRGISSHRTPYLVQEFEPKKNRRPVDSDMLSSSFFEYMCNLKFGVKHIRTENALFTTTELKYAKSYGTPYYVFPTDGCKLFYCNGTKDSFSLYDSMNNTILDSLKAALEKSKNENAQLALENFRYLARFTSVYGSKVESFADFVEVLDKTLKFKALPRNDIDEETKYQVVDALKSCKEDFEKGLLEFFKSSKYVYSDASAGIPSGTIAEVIVLGPMYAIQVNDDTDSYKKLHQAITDS